MFVQDWDEVVGFIRNFVINLSFYVIKGWFNMRGGVWVASFLRMALRVEKDATHSELFKFEAGTLRALGLAPPWPSL